MKNRNLSFELSDTQMEKLDKWKNSIREIYGEYGQYTYMFIPNGIGEGVFVESSLIGPEYRLDLTEIENW